MRIVVVGPGAIGCLFASFLAGDDREVVLLDKDPNRARAITAAGVCVEDSAGPRVVRVPATADPREVGCVDCLCLCVKAYDTASALDHAHTLIRAETTVVSLQNGLGNVERIAGRASPRQVVCAATSHGATNLGPGRVRHAGAGVTTVASYPSAEAGAADAFFRLLETAGLEAKRLPDARAMLWSKLIVNAAINPVTCVGDVPNGEILRRPDLRKLAFDAAGEAQAVAQALGVRLLYASAAAEVESVCQLTGDNVSSMLQDIRRGKRTEIDSISGAVVRAARDAEVPAPVNGWLLEQVAAMEQRSRSVPGPVAGLSGKQSGRA